MSDHSTSVHFPPEWAAQSAVLLAWPYAEGDFSPWLAEVEDCYTEIASAIAKRQRLIVACHNADVRQRVASRLAGDLAEVRLATVPYDDVWVRDTASLTVEQNSRPTLLDFRFNAWGNKYPHDNDAGLAQNLSSAGVFGETPLQAVEFVLEGGSVETDGAGTLMTTARCLLNPNRNPDYSQAQIEDVLKARFGVSRVFWLWHGHAEGDDTDAHIDTLARFCSPDTIAYTACDDPADSLYPGLQAMEAELQRLQTVEGQPYRLVPLPVPKPIVSEAGDRLPATYANFLIVNGAVLVPVYDDPADAVALSRLTECFPAREMVKIHATPLIRQYGSIHCMTMQFPQSVTVV